MTKIAIQSPRNAPTDSPSRDDVLKRMLKMPPKPHAAPAKTPRKPKAGRNKAPVKPVK